MAFLPPKLEASETRLTRSPAPKWGQLPFLASIRLCCRATFWTQARLPWLGPCGVTALRTPVASTPPASLLLLHGFQPRGSYLSFHRAQAEQRKAEPLGLCEGGRLLPGLLLPRPPETASVRLRGSKGQTTAREVTWNVSHVASHHGSSPA